MRRLQTVRGECKRCTVQYSGTFCNCDRSTDQAAAIMVTNTKRRGYCYTGPGAKACQRIESHLSIEGSSRKEVGSTRKPYSLLFVAGRQ